MTSDSFGRHTRPHPTPLLQQTSISSPHLRSAKGVGHLETSRDLQALCSRSRRPSVSIEYSSKAKFSKPQNGVETAENINNARNINFVSCHYLEEKWKQKNWIESQETNISKGSGESQRRTTLTMERKNGKIFKSSTLGLSDSSRPSVILQHFFINDFRFFVRRGSLKFTLESVWLNAQ